MNSIIESFLQELPEDNKGQDLYYTSIYDDIKNARTEEESYLSMGIWERELKRADWQACEKICTDALINKTKDLQIAAWLCEAWCHNKNWEGLVDSLLFIRQFCEKYWLIFYPEVDFDDPEPDLEHRIRILEWFIEMLNTNILFMPIIASGGITQDPLTFATWLSALNTDSVLRRSGGGEAKLLELENSGVVTLKKFRNFVKQAPIESIQSIKQKIKISLEETKAVEIFLKNNCQGQEPSFLKLYDILEDVNKICDFALQGRVLNEKKTDPEIEKVTSESLYPIDTSSIEISSNNSNLVETDYSTITDITENIPPQIDSEVLSYQQNTTTTPNNEGDNVTIENKKDAYKAVSDLADFLIEIEQQSFGPYILKLVASWGEKNFPEIIDDITTGNSQGHKMLRMLSGIVKKSEER